MSSKDSSVTCCKLTVNPNNLAVFREEFPRYARVKFGNEANFLVTGKLPRYIERSYVWGGKVADDPEDTEDEDLLEVDEPRDDEKNSAEEMPADDADDAQPIKKKRKLLRNNDSVIIEKATEIAEINNKSKKRNLLYLRFKHLSISNSN